MAIIKSFTDLSQSKKLVEILPLESSDMYYEWPNKKVHFKDDKYNGMGFSCWSLAALRNLLPPAIKPNKNTYLFESHNTFDESWVYRYYNEDDASYIYYNDTSEIDACVAMIERLHELNLL